MNADRRRLLGVLAGVAAGGAGASVLARQSSASTRVNVDAGDVTVESDDGTLRSLSVAPSGTVSWSGLETPAGSVTVALYAKLARDRGYSELATRRLDAAGLHGETGYAFETMELFATPGFASADFAARDGTTNATPVQLRFEIAVTAPDGTTLTTAFAVETFVVRVRNTAEQADVSGTANVGVETPTTTTERTSATSTGQSSTTTTAQGSTATTAGEATTTERDGTTITERGSATTGGANEGA